jgi:hypothetical protein
VGSRFRTAGEVVAALGAVQAQDYHGAKWALGRRVPGLVEADLEEVFNSGSILRTHVLRPTWHFVAPTDIRWMLALTAPRVRSAAAYHDRQHGVDARAVRLTRRVLQRALQDGRHLTRPELASALARAGLVAAGPRLAHLMLHAELDGLVCSGPRRGNQFTYALLEERVPPAGSLERDEALAELARRYFTSHGPATLRDFAWWSGLAARDAQAGIDGASLLHEVVGARHYWFAAPRGTGQHSSPSVLLLPNYDEYVIAYKDREVLLDGSRPSRRRPLEAYAHLLVIEGRLRGTWRRGPRSDGAIEVRPYRPLTRKESQALATEAARYGRFLGMPVVLA